MAYSIAHSPLVKTAFFASDPNLGRILAAIGYAGVRELDAGRVDLYIDDVRVARAGGRDAGYPRKRWQARDGAEPRLRVRAVLNRGRPRRTIWTCDLSFDYVKINAEYRTMTLQSNELDAEPTRPDGALSNLVRAEALVERLERALPPTRAFRLAAEGVPLAAAQQRAICSRCRTCTGSGWPTCAASTSR